MSAQHTSCPLDIGKRSLSFVRCEKGLKNLEPFYCCLPFLFGHRHEIWRRPSGTRMMVVRFSFVDWNTFESSLAKLPRN